MVLQIALEYILLAPWVSPCLDIMMNFSLPLKNNIRINQPKHNYRWKQMCACRGIVWALLSAPALQARMAAGNVVMGEVHQISLGLVLPPANKDKLLRSTQS